MRRESHPTHRFDLENPEDLARLAEPMLALKSLRGLVVIDEIQRHPDLFNVLRVLAGCIAYRQLGGFAVDEVGIRNLDRLWRRGELQPSYLARSEQASLEWRGG